ncbi:MAG: exodeoxyribonuclease VII large subunit [Candidatus Methanomethylophilaceae archaeon]
MTERLTVTQFNERVNSVVTGTPNIHNITIVGEIASMTGSSAGHFYPVLKDSESSLRCTLFRYSASRLTFKPEAGMKVTVFGSASYYVKGGSLSFNIESMMPYGKGELQAALEELAAKLLREGLFDADRKRRIPAFPNTIGVVTSPTGAVIKDIIDTTAKRFPVNILLAPAVVQGDGAVTSIVRGIELLNSEDVDVIIVGRGGGSSEDLSAFNTERVVRAIASSRIPVISAVGHATDRTLADRTADLYAETPTMAATLATKDRMEEKRNISNLSMRISHSLKNIMDGMRSRFAQIDTRLHSNNAERVIERYRMNLDRLTMRSDNALIGMMNMYRNRLEISEIKLDPRRLADRLNQYIINLDDISENMDLSIERNISIMDGAVRSLSQRLDGLDPTKVLGRGYSFIRDHDGNTLTSVSQLEAGQDVEIAMRDGIAVASVKDVKRND